MFGVPGIEVSVGFLKSVCNKERHIGRSMYVVMIFQFVWQQVIRKGFPVYAAQ